MDTSSLLWAVTGLTLAGIVKGATGLGYASSALPFLVMALGLKPAMAVVLIPAMATNFGLAFTAGHFLETLTRFKWLYVSMLPGIAVGLWVLTWIDQTAAVQVLGITLISYVAIAIAKPAMTLPRHLQQFLQAPTGFLNGVVTGVTGAQVMPLFPYMMSLQMDPGRTVQAINIAVMVASSILATGLLVRGLLTADLLIYSALGTIPALAGVAMGNAARRKLNSDRYRRFALYTLLAIGVMMLIR